MPAFKLPSIKQKQSKALCQNRLGFTNKLLSQASTRVLRPREFVGLFLELSGDGPLE